MSVSSHSYTGVRDDAWSPSSLTSDCDVIFFGDSQFRYLAEPISKNNPNFVPAVYFRSGAKVEDLCGDKMAQLFSQNTRACVVHIGTNSLKSSNVSPTTVFLKLKKVLTDITLKSPNCEIFISSVIPRHVNGWDEKTDFSSQLCHVQILNTIIAQYNELVSSYCKTNANLHYVNHDTVFLPTGQGVQSNLLARDGLHLSKHGIACVAKTLLKSLETFQFHDNKVETFQLQATSSHIDHSDNMAQVGVDTHASLGSLDYPPLPSVNRKVDTKSPYQPADPSLVITRAYLRKTSPLAAKQHRVTQSKQTNQSMPKGKPGCVKLSKVTKASSATICTAIRIPNHKPQISRVKAERSIKCSNRFALLSVDDGISETEAATCCSNIINTHSKASKKHTSQHITSSAKPANSIIQPSKHTTSHVTASSPVLTVPNQNPSKQMLQFSGASADCHSTVCSSALDQSTPLDPVHSSSKLCFLLFWYSIKNRIKKLILF